MDPEETRQWKEHRERLAWKMRQRLSGTLPEAAALAQFDNDCIRYGREHWGFFGWWDALSPQMQRKFITQVWQDAHLVIEIA